MKLSSDHRYRLFPDCANDAATGATVAAWLPDRTPHSSYPQTAEFLRRYGSEIPVPEPQAPDPDWGSFRVAMLSNAAYRRITLLASATPAGSLSVQRVENIMAMDSPNLSVLAVMWEQVLAQIPVINKPTSAEVSQWNTIAAAHRMPFTFGGDGKMLI